MLYKCEMQVVKLDKKKKVFFGNKEIILKQARITTYSLGAVD